MRSSARHVSNLQARKLHSENYEVERSSDFVINTKLTLSWQLKNIY